jgi:hypothetical protein
MIIELPKDRTPLPRRARATRKGEKMIEKTLSPQERLGPREFREAIWEAGLTIEQVTEAMRKLAKIDISAGELAVALYGFTPFPCKVWSTLVLLLRDHLDQEAVYHYDTLFKILEV